ncbi:MAG: SDR family oxidoreductase [Microcoleus vaginatus WJT46-NPBG5]|jgi:NAD(P)-dependent dehydrogenase (short-subunit alcohol dehydrogenase family)|nr:SDR family oxidoreductase [Microcoleus vaginatus WJT46-NPBG5]
MNDNKKIAVITGANRGLGLETCRQLASQGVSVILTSRDPSKGKEAASLLQSEGLEVASHPLDVTRSESIQQLQQYLRQEFGRLDVLVNNAGVLKDSRDPVEASIFNTKIDALRTTLETNLYAPLLLCQALIPLMKKGDYGRVVNVSSSLGQLSEMSAGYPTYRISKTALNAVTGLLAAELQGTNILVNSACPGWVKTDMGGPDAPADPKEGVKTIVWLATLPDGGPTGGFFRDQQPIAW